MKYIQFKHVLYIAILSVCFCVFVSCGNDVVKNDLLNYIANLKSISYLEKEAITKYESVSGPNYKNDKEVLLMLKATVIPKYSEFVYKLSNMNIKTKEVINLNEKYIEGSKKQLEALNIIAKGMEKNEVDFANQANLKLKEATNNINDYNNKLQILAKEHNIEIKK